MTVMEGVGRGQCVEGGNKAGEVAGARSWVIKAASVAAMYSTVWWRRGGRQCNQLAVSPSNPGQGR